VWGAAAGGWGPEIFVGPAKQVVEHPEGEGRSNPRRGRAARPEIAVTLPSCREGQAQ